MYGWADGGGIASALAGRQADYCVMPPDPQNPNDRFAATTGDAIFVASSVKVARARA